MPQLLDCPPFTAMLDSREAAVEAKAAISKRTGRDGGGDTTIHTHEQARSHSRVISTATQEASAYTD